MTKMESNTWQPQWSESEQTVFRDFGHAAFTAQMLEASIVQILLAVNFRDFMNGRVGKEFDIDAAMERKTLGQLIQVLGRDKLIDTGLTEILRDALDARNELIHRFFITNGEFVTEQGRSQMAKRLSELRFRIGRAQVVFSQIREKSYESFFGITKERAETLYQEHVAKQLARNQEGL
jgi:hypothetical protein